MAGGRTSVRCVSGLMSLQMLIVLWDSAPIGGHLSSVSLYALHVLIQQRSSRVCDRIQSVRYAMVIRELDITIQNHCDEVLFMGSVWMYAKSSTASRRLLLDTSRPELELCKYQV